MALVNAADALVIVVLAAATASVVERLALVLWQELQPLELALAYWLISVPVPVLSQPPPLVSELPRRTSQTVVPGIAAIATAETSAKIKSSFFMEVLTGRTPVQ